MGIHTPHKYNVHGSPQSSATKAFNRLMFFPAKYRKQQGKNRGTNDYVLEGPGGTVAMSSATFKFDKASPAAAILQAAFFEKLKETWCVECASRAWSVLLVRSLQPAGRLATSLSHTCRDPNCDESVAEYATALAAKGSDRQKIEKSLGALLGLSTAGDMCEW